jgi:Skp family chaperone for outer membrane proteins
VRSPDHIWVSAFKDAITAFVQQPNATAHGARLYARCGESLTNFLIKLRDDRDHDLSKEAWSKLANVDPKSVVVWLANVWFSAAMVGVIAKCDAMAREASEDETKIRKWLAEIARAREVSVEELSTALVDAGKKLEGIAAQNQAYEQLQLRIKANPSLRIRANYRKSKKREQRTTRERTVFMQRCARWIRSVTGTPNYSAVAALTDVAFGDPDNPKVTSTDAVREAVRSERKKTTGGWCTDLGF